LKKVIRSRHFRGLLRGGSLLVLIHVVGTLGYRYLGRPAATWIDSFYMTFITVATIGYAEVVDLSAHPMGRLFTVAIAVVGIATMSYLFSTFVALLLESDLNNALRKRHMERQIAALKGHYIVCGVGRVGSKATRVADLLPRSRDFLLMATHERGRWVFNPADDHIVQPGSALVLMTSPGGRSQVSSCCGPDGRQMRQAGFDSRRASLAASRRSASGAESCGTSKLRKGWAIARSRIASLSAQRSDTRSSASRSS
jgi:hypothetical protein